LRKKRDTSWAQKEERPKREGETEEDLEKRFYGSRLGFQCGLARQFQDPKTEGNSGSLKYVAIQQTFIIAYLASPNKQCYQTTLLIYNVYFQN
jgi:hypothetical protein